MCIMDYTGLIMASQILSQKITAIFLAKASWRIKNLQGAVRIAKKSKQTIAYFGGQSL